MTINHTILSGRLTREPELRQTPSGTAVLNFGFAFNERYMNTATGKIEERPNYIDCTIFGSRASGLAKVLSKGMHLTIEGKLHWNQWEREGQKRSKIELYVDNVEFDAKGSAAAASVDEDPYEPELAPYDLI